MVGYWNKIRHSIMKEEGSFIKEQLKKKNMTQVALANALGLYPANISAMLAGRTYIPTSIAQRLASILNFSLESFLQTRQFWEKNNPTHPFEWGKHDINEIS